MIMRPSAVAGRAQLDVMPWVILGNRLSPSSVRKVLIAAMTTMYVRCGSTAAMHATRTVALACGCANRACYGATFSTPFMFG
jgi:hypothetical protein